MVPVASDDAEITALEALEALEGVAMEVISGLSVSLVVLGFA